MDVTHEGFLQSCLKPGPFGHVGADQVPGRGRSDAARDVGHSYPRIVRIGVHAILYAARAFILPWLVSAYGESIQLVASKVTIYEGVLYSVIFPMAMLKLVREEDRSELLRESVTDYLTRLGNRRWFFEEGARIVHGGEGKRPMCVLAFGLDHFKSINDRYGHHTGDKVRKAFAEKARNVLGPGAILARLGREEFAALLSEDDTLQAKELGETVARRFAETIPGLIDGVGTPATDSIGLAWFENPARALADALVAADQALYRAK